MGGTSNDSSSSSSSMSPLSSPSSIVYVDLYGKRRQIAKVQVLEREIGLIQYVDAFFHPRLQAEIRFVIDPETSGRIFGERLVLCCVVVVVARQQQSVVHAARRQTVDVVAARVTKRKHVPRNVAIVPGFHATAVANRHVQNVRFVVVNHAHAFKCMMNVSIAPRYM
ncbi:hypothetical protein Ccrd_015796 [Cynara cardunculus var. scolymus]|uniref:Uncharacterized protein n=1 Tax=Cynara cardunculus var. scolymus TaxID=59895 RepID=A0A103YB75_CYNCS|nr:hypothetical protein Ccrd_015796 [Cynara cardunculus var. scolymus]